MSRVTTKMNGLFRLKGNDAHLEKIPIRQHLAVVITEICSNAVDRNQLGTKRGLKDVSIMKLNINRSRKHLT